MSRTYAETLAVISQIIQDTSNAVYDTIETGYWIEESLKELGTYDPHIVPIVFKIESRTGTTTSATSLTDTTKSQFIGGDATYEKVIHNTTDNTWAIVLANSSTSVNTISVDIMASGDNYRIYNKRCWNEKQIYIGDVTDYIDIDSVEYPIGTKRNWEVYDEVLEIDVGCVDNSDSTLTNLGNVDVLVRFEKPHRLCQMTDLLGAVHTTRDLSTLPVNAIIAYNFNLTETCEIGDEFHIANHRNIYTCTEAITWSDNTNGNVLYFYPELEATATALDVITFTKSTLKPHHEEPFCHLVAVRAVLSDNIKHINAIPKGGQNVWSDYQVWAERKLEEAQSKLRSLKPPRTSRTYTRG